VDEVLSTHGLRTIFAVSFDSEIIVGHRPGWLFRPPTGSKPGSVRLAPPVGWGRITHTRGLVVPLSAF
jgi:hypothetical protein